MHKKTVRTETKETAINVDSQSTVPMVLALKSILRVKKTTTDKTFCFI